MAYIPIPSALSIFHKDDGEPYSRYNSLSGLGLVANLGATAIDNDGQIDADGVARVVHWNDLAKERPPMVGKVQSMPAAALDKLGVPRLRDILAHSVELGLCVCYEAKGASAFTRRSVWRDIAADVKATGANFLVMTLPSTGDVLAKADAARAEGLPVMLLASHMKPTWTVPKDWWKHFDAVKGTTYLTKTAPAGMPRLGTGPANATKHGASCTRWNVDRVNARIASLGGVYTKPVGPAQLRPDTIQVYIDDLAGIRAKLRADQTTGYESVIPTALTNVQEAINALRALDNA